jgi:hypothetical protein
MPGTGGQRAGAPARDLAHQPAAARHGPGLRSETTSTRAARQLMSMSPPSSTVPRPCFAQDTPPRSAPPLFSDPVTATPATIAGLRATACLAASTKRRHPQARKNTIPITPPRKSRRADAGEGIDHEADERAVAEADDSRDIDRVDEMARLLRVEHRRLAAPHDMARPRTAAAGLIDMIWPITIQSNN